MNGWEVYLLYLQQKRVNCLISSRFFLYITFSFSSDKNSLSSQKKSDGAAMAHRKCVGLAVLLDAVSWVLSSSRENFFQ